VLQQSQCQQANRDPNAFYGLKNAANVPQIPASNSIGWAQEVLECSRCAMPNELETELETTI
jgi:hypothetical protein